MSTVTIHKYGKRHSIIQQPPNPTLFSGPIECRFREVSLYIAANLHTRLKYTRATFVFSDPFKRYRYQRVNKLEPILTVAGKQVSCTTFQQGTWEIDRLDRPLGLRPRGLSICLFPMYPAERWYNYYLDTGKYQHRKGISSPLHDSFE